jgi:1-acyl-sn-glycerol-3-phosphate acyltransferase
MEPKQMSQENQFKLLGQRRFLPFFVTQALGALNDNIFKNALLIMIAFRSVEELGINSGILVKLFLDNLVFLISVLFLLGLQSAAFGPIKYGILPQHLQREELTGGNGLIEMGTFISILLGTLLGGVLVSLDNYSVELLSLILVLVATCGYLASRQIPNTPAVAPDIKINWNPVSQTILMFRYIKGSRAVMLSILGVAWFWFYGSVFLAQIPNYTRFTLGGDESVTTLILASFAIGVGTGSILCEKLSNGRVEPGIVPIGAFGLSFFTIHLYLGNPGAGLTTTIGAAEFLQSWSNIRILIDIIFIGLSGGIFTVPLYAMVQNRTERSHLSRVVSGSNILNAFFMVMSGLYAIVFITLDFSVPQLFLITGLVNIAIALFIFKQVPEFIFRLIIWFGVHFMYRVRCENLNNIPREGGCVLVANHVSFVDALVIAGCCKRSIRFVMYHKIFNAPVVGRVFKMANAIPIAPANEDRAMMKKAFDEIDTALTKGHIVCIFPEGKLTKDGEVDKFRRGIERIVSNNAVPVIPLALKGLWNSWFSRRRGAAMSGLPGYFRGNIELVAGSPVPADQVSASHLESMVKNLRGGTK